MSEQGDAFVRLVLKGDPGMGDWSLDQAITWFRHKHHSNRAAACALGISESTLRGWARGARPKHGRGDALIAQARTDRTYVSKLGDQGTLVPLVTRERRRPDRTRDVSGVQLRLANGTTEAAREVWAQTGDSDAALRRFCGGIGEPWYRSQIARGAEFEDLVDDEYVEDADYGATIG